jgi:hypothetical protein
MPNRVFRDGLLDSEIVAGLHDRTFRLYTSMILSADDFGLVEIGFGPIKRANPLLDWSRETVAKMLGELTDASLILPYEADSKAFAAITKWCSQINSKRPKHPLPSFGLGHIKSVYGFKDASTRIEASKYIKHLAIGSGPPVPHHGPTSPPLVPEEGRGKREEKTSAPRKPASNRGQRLPAGWIPSPEYLAAARLIAPHWTEQRIQRAADEFRDYWLSAVKNSTKLDWLAVWRNRVRDLVDREPVQRVSPASHPAKARADEL